MSRNPPLRLQSSSDPVRVAVVSPDPIARAGLEAALGDAHGVELPARDAADVVLWDARSGDFAGLDQLPQPVVALVAEADQVDDALAAGARGVVLREHVGDGLLAALGAVRQGLTVIDAKLAKRRPVARKPLAEPLTRREQQVLELMADGLSNKLIAAELGISEHTAKFHVNGVLGKLDADTRTAAVVTGMRLGLLQL